MGVCRDSKKFAPIEDGLSAITIVSRMVLMTYFAGSAILGREPATGSRSEFENTRATGARCRDTTVVLPLSTHMWP